ncbi:MAG: hypothetical protein HXX16_08800 [Bacteroidales bacterium]|nr:hypothetical protein [Bacteroidales bacterium]
MSLEEKTDWHEILQKELERLSIGQMVFNSPMKMKQGIKERVTLRISRDLNSDITVALKGNGIPYVEKIEIYELMKVCLTGENFYIYPLSEEEQIIGKKGYAEWAWDILPEKFGKLILHLKITLRIRLPYGEELKDHPIIEKEITVKINPIYCVKIFVTKNWKWIITALIVPIIGWSLKMILK